MKKLLIFLILLAHTGFGQNITGSWSGVLKVMGTELPLVFHISETDRQYSTTMDSPKQGANGIPIEKTSFINNELTLEAPGMGIVYTAKLANENILEGTFKQGGMELKLSLEKGVAEPKRLNRPQEPQPPFPYYTEDFTLRNKKEGNLLAGSLFAPNQDKSIPIMVMITGSGSQDRNEELFGHKPFLVIADYLARNGIATFRMDDRGIGGSDPGKENATSADFAGDISSAVDFLAANGYTNIGLIGHSEGGMIAPMVKNKKVKFMILLAGPGIPIPELMKLQTYRSTLAMGVPEGLAQQAADKQEKLYRFINSYKGKNFENDLTQFLETENQGISPQQLKAAVNQLNTGWYKYFLAFDPAKYLKKVKVPVLALNGDKDVQVTSAENLEGIRRSLQKAKNKNYEIVEFPGLNHLFQTAKTGSVSEYEEIEETIAPEVLEKVRDWVRLVVGDK